ncbi:MAG: DUF5989 family protein [Candidatus Nanopelagicales bacterium]|mgnify:FL=1|jgi:uncharacterized membrane protein
MNFFRELVRFLRSKNKLWLLPIIGVMLLLALLLLAAQTSVFAPFIYTLF